MDLREITAVKLLFVTARYACKTQGSSHLAEIGVDQLSGTFWIFSWIIL